MKKRLFLYTTLILCVGLLTYFVVSVYVVFRNNLSFAEDSVRETAGLYANLYGEGIDPLSLTEAGSDTRITVIASNGEVLADSRPLDVDGLENHLDRPEIQAAAQGAPATHIRYSETLGTDLMYYALVANRGDGQVFIRVAIPIAQIDTYLFESLPLLITVFLLVVLCCFFFSRRMIARTTAPFESVAENLHALARGNYTQKTLPESYEEINTITRGIDEVASQLQGSFTALRDEKAKLSYILDNIGDGLFVVDETRNIVLINAAGLRIFNAQAEIVGRGLNYLLYDEAIISALNSCLDRGTSALFDLELQGSIYYVVVKRLPETSFGMVVLSDVSENRKNARRREEFFANASHELKTPLTAIKGFNELAALKGQDENIHKYIEGISRETSRMLSLLEDMLKLSELENTEETKPITVPLAALAGEVRETLSTALSEKALHFEVRGDAEVYAEPNHVYDLMKNLIENAVRYTGQGGRVSVTITRDDSGQAAQLVVSDNGIGIAPEEQSRVFERFYRVEKSRSQRNGGTGLGLSIVKHICVLYNWQLSLSSKLGLGTDVTVTFKEDL